MRLFIAFEIPDIYSELLSANQDLIKARASFPKSFHLTLKFLGEVEDVKVDALIENLNRVSFKKVDAYFSGIGCFPNDRNPKVVWLALEPQDILTKIAEDVESVTADFGIRQDKTFIPHITIARIKHVANADTFMKSLDCITIPTEPFELNEFKLIKSKLTPEGPVYEVLRTFRAQQ